MLSELGNVYCGAWSDSDYEETPVKRVVKKVKKAAKKVVKVVKGE